MIWRSRATESSPTGALTSQAAAPSADTPLTVNTDNSGGTLSTSCRLVNGVVPRLATVPTMSNAVPVAPADFLRAAAHVVAGWADTGPPRFPDSVTIGHGLRLATERFVADDSPAVFDWVIHPAGFHAPRIMEQAKLQAWTLKPAER